jgi:hypothetical protein
LYGVVGVDSDREDDPNFGGRYVQCDACYASTRLIFPVKDDVDHELAEAWNRRDETIKQLDKEVGRRRKMVRDLRRQIEAENAEIARLRAENERLRILAYGPAEDRGNG